MLNIKLGASMTWGKHRGTPLEDVPADYLRWVLKSGYGHSDLHADIKAELRARPARPIEPGPTPGTVQYVIRPNTGEYSHPDVFHLTLNGNLPRCGYLYSWKGYEHFYDDPPDASPCTRCFPE